MARHPRLPALIPSLLLVLLQALPAAAEDPIRFAEVAFRILTTGERQATQEVAAFHASLPLGTPGRLSREVSISNETRSAQRKILLDLALTPLLAEDGTLHLMVLSDAKPEDGPLVSRARDLLFRHAGDQLMEAFADPVTGTHLVLAIQASLPPEEVAAAAPRWPRLRFAVKVERWDGAVRNLIDTVQLVSEDGLPVTHRYERRVPLWVERARSKSPDYLSDLPVVDPDDGKTTLPSGQGFSILLPGAKKPSQEAPPGDGSDGEGPAESQPTEGSGTPKVLTWVQEDLEISVMPVEMRGDGLSLLVSATGNILPADSEETAPLGRREVSKTVRAAEPAPLYLTREEPTGPRGYVIWVVPEW